MMGVFLFHFFQHICFPCLLHLLSVSFSFLCRFFHQSVCFSFHNFFTISLPFPQFPNVFYQLLPFLDHLFTVSTSFLCRFRFHLCTASITVSSRFPANNRHDKDVLPVFVSTLSIYVHMESCVSGCRMGQGPIVRFIKLFTLLDFRDSKLGTSNPCNASFCVGVGGLILHLASFYS
jgi:hypothetical protein